MTSQTIEYEWVIGTWTGDRAKSVRAHADAGICYFVQRAAGAGPNYTVQAAFRRTIDGPRPDHMQPCTSLQVEKLERLHAKRQGIGEREQHERVATAGISFADMMGARHGLSESEQ